MKKSLSLLFFLASFHLVTPANAVALAANQAAKEPPTSSVEDAQAMVASGRLDAALTLLNSLPRGRADEALINHLLGVVYYQKADYIRAVQALSQAVAQSPRDGKQFRQGMQLLAMSHYLLGHIAEAIPLLEQVRTWSPDDAELTYVLGVSYLQSKSVEKARACFAQMFEVAPSSASAYVVNAQMMMRQSLEELAEKELQRALELDARAPQANFLLGELAIYKANVDAGIDLMKKELTVNPTNAMAYYRLGEALTRQQKWNESILPLQKSIWLNPYFSGPFIVLGKAYLKKNDLGNAESILRRALKMDPNNVSGHHLLAQTLQQANRTEEARREFEIADRLRVESEK